MTRVWPTDLFSVHTDDEATSATMAVHECAHAVMATDLGCTVDVIDLWPHEEFPGDARTLIAYNKANMDLDSALTRAAGRPATVAYWHTLGMVHKNHDVLTGIVEADEKEMRHYCHHDAEVERYVQRVADRWVIANWARICTLAHTLIQAHGRLDYPHILPSTSIYAPGASCGYHHRRPKPFPRRIPHQ